MQFLTAAVTDYRKLSSLKDTHLAKLSPVYSQMIETKNHKTYRGKCKELMNLDK